MKKFILSAFLAILASSVNAESLEGCFHYEYISDIVYYGEVEVMETSKGTVEIKDKEGVIYVLTGETEEELCFEKK